VLVRTYRYDRIIELCDGREDPHEQR